MSQFKPVNSLSTNSMHVAAIRLKSANQYIFRALLSLASAALLIRVMGIFNQAIVSSHFGAGMTMDAYFVAYTSPTLVAYLIIGALEAAVVPVYARIRSQGKKEQAFRLFSTLLNLLLVGTALLTLIMLIFRQQIILLSAPALDSFRTELAIALTPFLYPVLLLMVVIGYLEAIFNAEGQFGWPAYAGVFVPLTTAVLVLTMGNSYGVVMLCVGTLVGLCLQLCAFIVRAKQAGLIYRPVIDWRNSEIGSILSAAWPALLGALIIQASPLVDQIFASFLSAGSISALSYSLKLISVFSGVIFASVGRAALPYLSRQAASNDMRAFKETLRLYLWVVGIGTMVLSAIVLVLAHPIVQILFQRGAFSAEDTDRTATTLIGFVVGLTPMALGIIVSWAFNALGKTRVFIRVAIFSVIANAVFDYIFARLWQSQGIALSTSLVYIGTMSILFFMLHRTIGKLHLLTPPSELLNFIGKLGMGHRATAFSSSSGGASFGGVSQQIVRISIAVAFFTAGVAGILLNYLLTVRAALGSVVILAFLRYRYALLMVWVVIGAFIGSVPIFSGNNYLTGLTVPTLLLMAYISTKQTFKRMPALAFLLIYLMWVFASIVISSIGIGAFLTLWFTYLDYVAVAVLAIHVLTTRRRLMGFIDIMLLTSLFISLYGIYGYITRQNGLLDPATSVFRIFSVFGSSPTFALFLSIVIPLALYRILILRSFKRVGFSIIVLVLLVALGLTLTRSTFITVAVSVGIMVLFLPSRKLKIGLLGAVLVLSILVVFLIKMNHIPIFERFFNQDITTLNGRTILWQALLDHFDPTQLLGNGLNASYALLANLNVSDTTNQGVIATAPHSLFLGILYDHGFIGLTLLILIFIALPASLIKGMRKATGEHRMLLVTALAIFVSVFIQSLQNSDFWFPAIGIYFWIIMALPFALYWFPPEQLSDSQKELFDRETEPRTEAIQIAGREQIPLARSKERLYG